MASDAAHPLTAEEVERLDPWWRAANYLAVGMIYLQDNPLLREPLKPEHIKNRLLGHWGSSPGQAFIWAHANRVIQRQELPELRVRVLNVVKLFALTQPSEHPHGLSDRDFDTLFTTDRPVLFNFHGYPWLIHRLTYRRRNHANFHVRGYKEKGNINTPLELAMNNQIDRFSLVIDVIDRVPGLRSRAAHIKEQMKESILANRAYAHEHGMDAPEISNWQWSTAVQTELA